MLEHSSRDWRSALIFATIIFALSNAGCAALLIGGAAAGGAAGYAYHKGDVTRVFIAPLEDTYQATIVTLQDHHLPIASQTVTAESRQVETVTSGGDRVRLFLEPVANGTRQPLTRVHIRVGWFGDNDLSRSLHDQIGAQLSQRGQMAPIAPAASGNLSPPSRIVPIAATVEPPVSDVVPAKVGD